MAEIEFTQEEQTRIRELSERIVELQNHINDYMSSIGEDFEAYDFSEDEVYEQFVSGDLSETAETIDRAREICFEGYYDKLSYAQLDDETRDLVAELDEVRKDIVVWEVDYNRLSHEAEYTPMEVASTLERNGLTVKDIDDEINRREYNRYSTENVVDLVSEQEILRNFSDRLLDEARDILQEREEARADKVKTAMKEAGYDYDDIDSGSEIVFNGEMARMRFVSWEEAEEWLDGVVFDDPDISDRVERVMHPERFDTATTEERAEESMSMAEILESLKDLDVSVVGEMSPELEQQIKESGYSIVNGRIVNLAEINQQITNDMALSEERARALNGNEVAIESSEDYPFAPDGLVPANMSGYAYRIVKISEENGLIVPYDKQVFPSVERAREAIKEENLTEVNYDTLIRRAEIERELRTERANTMAEPKEEYYKFFYDYEIDQAREYFNSHREENYHWLVGGEEQGFNGGTIAVYRNVSDLPEWCQGYAQQMEDWLAEQNTTHYYEPELEIEGTSDEMYNQVVRNYVDRQDTLTRLEEILRAEGKDDKADVVSYYNAELSEDTSLYSVNRMKIDFLDSRNLHQQTGGGIDDVTIHEAEGERTSLSVFYEPHNDTVVISVSEITADSEGVGATSVSLDDFLKMSRADFERTVNEVIAYGMERTEIEREDERTKVQEPIEEFIDNEGYLYNGSSIPTYQAKIEGRIDDSTIAFYADRRLVYNAVQQFEQANNVANPVIRSDGSYEDKDFLYDAYDEYLGLSHYAEMSAKYGNIVEPIAEANVARAVKENEEHGYSMSTNPVHYASVLYAQLYYAEHNLANQPEKINVVAEVLEQSKSPYASVRAEDMAMARAMLSGEQFTVDDVRELMQKDYSTRGAILDVSEYTNTDEQFAILKKAESMESAHSVSSIFIEANRDKTLDPNRYNDKAEAIMEIANRFTARDNGKPWGERFGEYANDMLSDFALGVDDNNVRRGFSLSADEIRMVGEKMISDDKFMPPEEVKAFVKAERDRVMAEQEKQNAEISHGENEKSTDNGLGRDKKPNKLSEAEQKRNELRNSIGEGVERIRDSEEFKAWLLTRSHNFMNKYSFNNMILVAMQRPDASTVMGYDKWQEFGRQVNAGAKGIQIFTPVTYSEKQEGNLARDIVAELYTQLKQGKAKAEYQLQGLMFSMNQGSSAIQCTVLSNNHSVTFANRQELNDFIQKNINNKMPKYFTVANVFDVKDTYIPNFLSVSMGKARQEEFVRGRGEGVAITNDEGKVLAKAVFSKEPNAPRGYDWVDKSEIGKGVWNMVSAPMGEPIQSQAKPVKFLIYNTEERYGRFRDELEMKVVAKNPEMMKRLFEAIKGVVEQSGVPVKVVSKDSKEWGTSKEANGYFKPPVGIEVATYPKGYIVIPSELLMENPAHAVKTLIHEKAHADLHGENLKKIEELIGQPLSREMKETQAESIAFMVSENFGIDTSDYSFKYLASWANDAELSDFKKSVQVIDNEAMKLITEIDAELERLGLSRELKELPKEPLTDIEVAEKIGGYKEQMKSEYLVVEQMERKVSALATELKGVGENLSDGDKKAYNERVAVLDVMKSKLERIHDEIGVQTVAIESLQSATTRAEQDEISAKIESSFERSVNLHSAFSQEEKALETIAVRNLEGLKEQFERHGVQTLNKLTKEYPQIGELSGSQKWYIANSPYIRQNLTQLLSSDPQKFIDEVIARAKSAEKASAKNGMFVEVISVKTVTTPPFVQNGDLSHPKIMDKIIASAEKDIEKIKSNSDFFPNADTQLAIYSFTEKGNLTATICPIRVGDGTQTSLGDYLQKACNKGEVVKGFFDTLSERPTKAKYISENEVAVSHGEKENADRTVSTMDEISETIKARKEEASKSNEDGKEASKEQDKSVKKGKDGRG